MGVDIPGRRVGPRPERGGRPESGNISPPNTTLSPPERFSTLSWMGSDENRLIKIQFWLPSYRVFPYRVSKLTAHKHVSRDLSVLITARRFHRSHWIWLSWRLSLSQWWEVIIFTGLFSSVAASHAVTAVESNSLHSAACLTARLRLRRYSQWPQLTQSCLYKRKTFRSWWDLRWDLRRIGFGRRSSTPVGL